ncbi:glycoside hydrolase family 57 protein [bacterium]|nr:glycoside hydrolase family 57 protein [bacterium]
MKPLYVALLWHMHQPYYKDSLTGSYHLPWVRLHALKGYYDMAFMAQSHPEARLNFNLTPSLLKQLKDYAQTDIQDRYLTLSEKPAGDLELEERKFILANFFMVNWETMLTLFPRYQELLEKRGRQFTSVELEKSARQWKEGEIRDLQVLFNLAWFGYGLRKEEKEIDSLFKKGGHFSEGDKELVLKKQREAIARIIPMYRKLQEEGRIEISTSPFYHPILPLLNQDDPRQEFDFKEDIPTQMESAISFHKELFGLSPRGCWPPEGSVSQGIIPYLVERGIEWIATDEEILTESLKAAGGELRPDGRGEKREDILYQPFQYQGLTILFRDKNFSNTISFNCYKEDPQVAVRNFLGGLAGIREKVNHLPGDHLITLAMDGENSWEYYKDGGESFLNGLYSGVAQDPHLRMIRIADFLKEHPPSSTLSRLIPGSWVSHNFDIWIGKPEKDQAWQYLHRAREFLLKEKERDEKAWDELYAAEGSDWFWWYDDDFSSANDQAFDELFRTHLGNVYKSLKRPIPHYLKESLISLRPGTPLREPSDLVTPLIDGKITSYHEWLAGGWYRVGGRGGTRHRGQSVINGIGYGFDRSHLYLLLEVNMEEAQLSSPPFSFFVTIKKPRPFRIEGTLKRNSKDSLVWDLSSGASMLLSTAARGELRPDDGRVAIDEVVEIALPFSLLKIKPKDEVLFTVGIGRQEALIEEWPKHRYISLIIPDEYEISSRWSV